MKGRISKPAWDSWEDGIRINMSGVGFQKAWQHLRSLNSNRFNELNRLLSETSPSDPKKWD